MFSTVNIAEDADAAKYLVNNYLSRF